MSGNARKSQKLLEGSVLLESSFLTVSRPLSSLSLHKSVEKFRTTVWILFPECCCFFVFFFHFYLCSLFGVDCLSQKHLYEPHPGFSIGIVFVLIFFRGFVLWLLYHLSLHYIDIFYSRQTLLHFLLVFFSFN